MANQPLTGLWVGEVSVDRVNEVTVPLDENNIPRAPEPGVPTATSDVANLRLILHVDGEGKTRLLKHVAIAARDEATADSDSDVILITDPALYANIGGQRASRISSAAFDFADPVATAALETLVDDMAAAAAIAANGDSPDLATVEREALAAATAVIENEADADQRFVEFYTTYLTPSLVETIAVDGTSSTAYANAESNASLLESGSFVGDRRGIEMLAAIVAASNASTGDAAKKRAAKLAAASFIEDDDAYNQFLASNTMRGMVDGVAEGLVDAFALVDITDYSPIVFATILTSPGHGLTSGDLVTVANSASIYNGLMPVEVIDADRFSIRVPYEARVVNRDYYWSGDTLGGGAIVNFASAGASLTELTANDHGLSSGDVIEITGSDTGYNGLHTVTVIDADTFTIPVAYADRVIVGDTWAGPVFPIVNYETGPSFVNIELDSNVTLSSTNSVYIVESGLPLYNRRQDSVIQIDGRNVVLDLLYDPDTSNPTFKGELAVIPDRAALESATDTPSSDARRAALLVNIPNYESSAGEPEIGSRASDAVAIILESMVSFIEAQSEMPTALDIAAAGYATLDNPARIARFAQPTKSPSDAYQDFIASDTYLSAPEVAAEAAAEAALVESGELLATESSIRDKAKAAALTALRVAFSTAARVSMNEQPVDGTFALGSTDLTTTLTLPASHPTNPFRHRRHPDHVVGVDVTRVIELKIDAEPETFRQTGYGVFVVSGTYAEEIFGLHKNLGPAQDIGLRVSGSFTLNRVSTVDTLNSF